MSVPSLPMNDGRSIPQIGFGVWQVPDSIVTDATLCAFENGYRHVDTASIYENERGVGEAIARSGLDREDLFITTKVWNRDHGYDKTLANFEVYSYPEPGSFVMIFSMLMLGLALVLALRAARKEVME